MAETIDIGFKADISDVKKRLKELPKETGKAAQKSVRELVKTLKALEKQATKVEKAEKAAVREAKRLAAASGDLKARGRAGFEAIKQAAEGVGGSVGGAAGMVEKFGRSAFEAGAALGPVGAAATVAAVAIGAAIVAAGLLSAAMFSGVAAADEWLAALREAGAADDLISAEQQVSLREANASIDALWLAAKRVGVVLAGEFSDGVRLGAGAALLLVTGLEQALTAIFELIGGTHDLIQAMTGLDINGPANMALGLLEAADAARSLRAATGEAATASQGLGARMAALNVTVKESAAAAKKAGITRMKANEIAARAAEKNQRELDAAERAAERARLQGIAEIDAARRASDAAFLGAVQTREAAEAKLAGLTLASRSDILTAEDEIEQTYQRQMDAIAELTLARADQGTIIEALDEAEARRQRDLAALAKDASAAKAAEIKAIAGAAASQLGSMMGNLSDLIGTSSEQIGRRIADAEAALDAAHKAGGRRKIEAAEQELKHARKSFRAQQTLQRGAAIMDAAAAALAMTSAMAYLGPLAPAAAVLAVAPVLATQLITIDSQPPPSFAAGGVAGRATGPGSAPDHVTIQADPREGILTPRATAALGAGGLAALNGGGSLPMTVILQLDGRTLAQAILSPGVKRELIAELRPAGIGRGTTYGRG